MIIHKLAVKQNILINAKSVLPKEDMKVVNMALAANFDPPLEERQSNLKNRKDFNFNGLEDLMCAVTANRTMVHYGQKHVCVTHQCKVDKKHIDLCSHLKLKHPVTEFNKDLQSKKLY